MICACTHVVHRNDLVSPISVAVRGGLYKAVISTIIITAITIIIIIIINN
jgi:hypothetical protein